ncbi:MAG: hypothetical protein Q8P20_09575 [bacterium]|nr:hypothetical protein [bacterium]
MKENFINKQAKIFFKNGISCEGVIQSWSDDCSVLLDGSSNSQLYIYNTKENVMMIKFANATEQAPIIAATSQPPTTAHIAPTVEAVNYKKSVTPFVEPPPPELIEPEPNIDFRLQKLAALRAIQLSAIKQDATRHLNSPIKAKTINYYEQPHFKK